ncbi:MAG: hypothetical protein LUB59_02680, partial [Candidatus Gastranaerophilales bacterium]|nr:hypothetical protein [Candidatus Gastranaerophilales bacterium]
MRRLFTLIILTLFIAVTGMPAQASGTRITNNTIYSGTISEEITYQTSNDITAGGAIYNYGVGSITLIDSSTFTEDHAKYGGAIYNAKTCTIKTISNSTFSYNTATISGGAIYSTGTLGYITNCVFTSNAAYGDTSSGAGYGGAIYANKSLTITNSTFTGNYAYRKGGAIAQMSGNLTIIAEDSGSTVFSGNTQGTSSAGNDIYLGGSGQSLYLYTADANSSITINSGIDFSKSPSIYINKTSSSSDAAGVGTITIGGNVGSSSTRANMYLYGGTLSFINNEINNVYASKVTLYADTTLGFDIDLTSDMVDYDTFYISSFSGTGKLVLTADSFNIISGFSDEDESATLTLISSSASFRSYIRMYDEDGNSTNIIYIYDNDGTTPLYKVKLASNGSIIFSDIYYIDKETNPLVYAVNYEDSNYYNLTLTKNITVDSWEDIQPNTPRNELVVDTLTITGKNKTITAEDNLVGMNVNGSGKYLSVDSAIFIGFSNAITNNEGEVYLYRTGFKNNINTSSDDSEDALYGSAISNVSGTMTILGTSKSTKSVFYNNEGENGGAIYNSGDLSITYTSFGKVPTKKVVYSNIADNGGAIYNAGNLSVTSSSFIDNEAENGGALYNIYADESDTAAVLLTGATFTHNVADEAGGAIYNTGTMTATTSTFGNKSKKTSYANTAEYGGAVANYDDGIFYSYGSSYYYNIATYGGAIYNTSAAYINGGTITGNTADYGGAIYNNTDATLSLDRYTYYTTSKKGVVTTKYTALTFSSNTAIYGGAIYNEGTITPSAYDTYGMPTSIAGTFSKNKATTENQTVTTTSDLKDDDTLYTTPKGGAIYNAGSMTLTNASFTSNSASAKVTVSVKEYASGSTVVSEQITKYAGKGGAIYSASSNDINIINTTFSKNTAAEAGGAIYNENSDATVYITNSNFTSNTASSVITTVTTTQTIVNGIASKSKKTTTKETIGEGGAIYTTGNVEINTNETYESLAEETIFKSNSATTGGAIYAGGTVNAVLASFTSNKATAGSGGAIYTNNDVTIENSVFSKNSATSNGGGIYGDDVSVRDSTFTSNSSKANGGAIYALGDVYVNAIDYSDSSIINGTSTFTSNSATGSGGAIYSSGTTLVKDTTFTSNSSKANGGAIYSADDITVVNSTFNKNSAVNGGAVYVEEGKEAVFINTSFTNNKASQLGGAIYAASASTVYIIAYSQDVVISGNKAGSKANSIYLDNATLYLDTYSYTDSAGNTVKYSITLSDGIIGTGDSKVYLMGTGTLNITSNISGCSFSDESSIGSHTNINCEEYIQNTSFYLSGNTTVSIANSKIGTLALATLSLADDTTTDIAIDMDLQSATS